MLEDDIGFRDGFNELLDTVLTELPDDWDALWLGGQQMRTTGFSKSLKRLQAGTGGYGVLFRETMYEDLIRVLGEEKFQADVSYMKLQPLYNCFRTVQNLILHKAGMSTIQKRHVSYPALEA